ncbi:hypothetical protein FALBO_12466 [Fusarium albosuccineum]|uniref:Uncharacterized protein n=1 Tax=Fusarium albosuccineum TaxID=1237068 RepID=A0A8H4L0M5_9HYPO|nr:hypothetical protein FALBO_12466 [Fusarium albosuccineum]
MAPLLKNSIEPRVPDAIRAHLPREDALGHVWKSEHLSSVSGAPNTSILAMVERFQMPSPDTAAPTNSKSPTTGYTPAPK